MSDSPKEVIIDTDFLNKITLAPHVENGKDLFIRTMSDLNARPVVHYYLADREMKVNNAVAAELIDTEYIKVYRKEDFIKSEEDEELYKEYFRKWYNFLNLTCPLEKNVDVFSLFRAQHSLGEIHSTLLAYFMNLDIIMSDDSDARELVAYSGLRNVNVWNLVDVYSIIGKKEEKTITISEVENVIRSENTKDSINLKRIKKEKFRKVKSVWIST